MTPNEYAAAIVKKMINNDPMSQWLGIETISILPGEVVLQMTIRKEMTNGFGVAHGGITYSLADSALAFAANGYGQKAMSIETSISHTRPVLEGMTLTATAKTENLGRRFGIFRVIVQNEKKKTVALFKGTVFRQEEKWTVG